MPMLALVSFKRRSTCMHQFHSLGQNQSTVAQQAESCGWVFRAFFWQVPTLCLDSIACPFLPHWVPSVYMFGCNVPPALLAEWPTPFTCPMVTWRWRVHQIRVSTEGWLWGRKFSSHWWPQPGINPVTFGSWARCSANWTISTTHV